VNKDSFNPQSKIQKHGPCVNYVTFSLLSNTHWTMNPNCVTSWKQFYTSNNGQKNHSISFYYKLCSSWLLPHYKRFGVSVQKIVTDHRLSIMYHSLKLVHALLVVGFKCVTQQWYCFLPEYGCVTLFKLCTSPMLHHQQTLLINYQVSSSNFA
jgi:hypothetical protein